LISPVSECAKPPSYQPRPDGRERWRYGGLKTRSKLLIPRNPLVAHALMRAVFALLRTPVATEPKRSQERGTIPCGNVFGGRKLAFPPPWRSVFPRNRLFRFAFAVHPCLRELSGECERGTESACATSVFITFCRQRPMPTPARLSRRGLPGVGFHARAKLTDLSPPCCCPTCTA